MQNKLPKKYENTFFGKMRRFFVNLFRKNATGNELDTVIKEKNVYIKSKENEFDKIKESSKKVKLKEDILTLIEKNPDLINTLSLERLKELDNMYDDIIAENDRKIKKLKREIA